MPLKNNEAHTVYFGCVHPTGYSRDHELELDITYKVGEDGIGPYEFWGEKGFDHGNPYIYDYVINAVYLVRTVHVMKREDVPSISGIRILKLDNEDGWLYMHYRAVSTDTVGVEELGEEFQQEYDFSEDFDPYDEPEYEPTEEYGY